MNSHLDEVEVMFHKAFKSSSSFYPNSSNSNDFFGNSTTAQTPAKKLGSTGYIFGNKNSYKNKKN